MIFQRSAVITSRKLDPPWDSDKHNTLLYDFFRISFVRLPRKHVFSLKILSIWIWKIWKTQFMCQIIFWLNIKLKIWLIFRSLEFTDRGYRVSAKLSLYWVISFCAFFRNGEQYSDIIKDLINVFQKRTKIVQMKQFRHTRSYKAILRALYTHVSYGLVRQL